MFPLDFVHCDQVINNLGGQGPDTGVPEVLRFTNALVFLDPVTGQASGRFDVVVEAVGGYSVFDSNANTLADMGNGKRFAGVPTETDSGVVGAGIRVGTSLKFKFAPYASCCAVANCYKCAKPAYASTPECQTPVCCCYGDNTFSMAEASTCDHAHKAARGLDTGSTQYECSTAETWVGPALVALGVWSIDPDVPNAHMFPSSTFLTTTEQRDAGVNGIRIMNLIKAGEGATASLTFNNSDQSFLMYKLPEPTIDAATCPGQARPPAVWSGDGGDHLCRCLSPPSLIATPEALLTHPSPSTAAHLHPASVSCSVHRLPRSPSPLDKRMTTASGQAAPLETFAATSTGPTRSPSLPLRPPPPLYQTSTPSWIASRCASGRVQSASSMPPTPVGRSSHQHCLLHLNLQLTWEPILGAQPTYRARAPSNYAKPLPFLLPTNSSPFLLS